MKLAIAVSTAIAAGAWRHKARKMIKSGPTRR
jgi:hypothetical protein